MLTAGVEALHDEFTSFNGAVFFVPQPAAQGGGNLQVVGSAKGNKLPNTPNITFNVGLHYDVPIGFGRVRLSTTYAYMGRWFQGPDNILRSPASNLVNAQIGWTSPNDKTGVTFWVNNLTNQVVPMFLQAAGNAGGYSEQVNQPPRTLGVTLKQTF